MKRKLEVKLTRKEAQEYWHPDVYGFKHAKFDDAKRFNEELISKLLKESPDQGFTEEEIYDDIWEVVFGFVVGCHMWYNDKKPGGCDEIRAWVNWDDVTLHVETSQGSVKDEGKASISKKLTAEVETTEASSTDHKGKMKFKSPRKHNTTMDRENQELVVTLTKQQIQEYGFSESYSFNHSTLEDVIKFKERHIGKLLQRSRFSENETYDDIWEVVLGFVIGCHNWFDQKNEISARLNWDKYGHVTLQVDTDEGSEKVDDKSAISKKRTAELENSEASSTDHKGKMKFKSPRKKPRDETRELSKKK
jgi:hypothetical protein